MQPRIGQRRVTRQSSRGLYAQGLVLLALVLTLQLPSGQAQQSVVETSLMSQPECLQAADELVCDMNLELTSTSTAAVGNATASSGIQIVEAALTCPSPTATPLFNLSSVQDPATCGCTAVLADSNNGTTPATVTTRQARECTCRLCPSDASKISIDCSAAESGVFPTCQVLACDGTCLEKAASDTATTTENSTATTPTTTVGNTSTTTDTEPTESPTTTTPTTGTTTEAPTSETNTEEGGPSEPPSPPDTPPPVNTNSQLGGTPWYIPAAFYISNSQSILANQLSSQILQQLQTAFVKMVETHVVQDIPWAGTLTLNTNNMDNDMDSSNNNNNNNNSTNTTTESRTLQASDILYDPEKTEVYVISDQPCPAGDEEEGTCQIAYGRFQLRLLSGEVDTTVTGQYEADAKQAIDDGLLQEALLEDASSLKQDVTILTSATPNTPYLAADTCTLCEDGSEPLAPSLSFGESLPGVPPGDLKNMGCARISLLYAQQSPEACLNYANSGLMENMSPSLQTFFQRVLPLEFQAYCQCPTGMTQNATADQGSVVVPTVASSTTDPSGTTCGVFCAANKQIPPSNYDIVVDSNKNLTCAILERMAYAAVNAPNICLDLSRHAAICCTDNIDTPEVETSPSGPFYVANSTDPAPMKTIPSSFLVYNTRGLSADVLMLGPELESMSRSYAAFVEKVVTDYQASGGSSGANNNNSTNSTDAAAEDDGATAATVATRHLRGRPVGVLGQEALEEIDSSQTEQEQLQQRRQRRLEIFLDAYSAEVYQFNDTDCPTTVPFGSNCSIVYGQYNLYLTEGEDDEEVWDEYVNLTQKAIGNGLLNETIMEVDPYTWLIVKGPTDHLAPPVPVQPPVEYIYNENFFMIGIGVSIAAIVLSMVGVICAADYSQHDDDDSIDPWEKETMSRASSQRSGLGKEKAPKKKREKEFGKDLPPKTERQEYEMYRGQVEKLIEVKLPEEYDNIDDLMDLFYTREMILIAMLKHMPDCSEHEEMAEEQEAMDWKSAEEEDEGEDDDDEDGDSFAEDTGEDGSEPSSASEGGITSIPEMSGDEDESEAEVDNDKAENDVVAPIAELSDEGESDSDDEGGDAAKAQDGDKKEETEEEGEEKVDKSEGEGDNASEDGGGDGETWDDEDAQQEGSGKEKDDGDKSVGSDKEK